jgi:hypothetical protein
MDRFLKDTSGRRAAAGRGGRSTRVGYERPAFVLLLNAPALVALILLAGYPIVSLAWIDLHKCSLKRPRIRSAASATGRGGRSRDCARRRGGQLHHGPDPVRRWRRDREPVRIRPALDGPPRPGPRADRANAAPGNGGDHDLHRIPPLGVGHDGAAAVASVSVSGAERRRSRRALGDLILAAPDREDGLRRRAFCRSRRMVSATACTASEAETARSAHSGPGSDRFHRVREMFRARIADDVDRIRSRSGRWQDAVELGHFCRARWRQG